MKETRKRRMGKGWGTCFFIFIAVFIKPSPEIADDGDWQHWTEASWTQKLGNGLDAGLRLETRWEEDVSTFSYYEIEPALNWRHSPRWDFAVGYERDERLRPSEEIAHIPNMSATVKFPRQPWKIIPVLDWRLSNRSRMEFMVPEDDAMDWQAVYRNRTDWEARWKWGSKELLPFVFEEWFFNTDRGDFTQNRAGIGIGIPIVSHWLARVYWMRLDEKTTQGWEWHPVFGAQIMGQF